MSSNHESRNPPDGLDPRIWRVATVVFVGPFMTQLDSTVVNVSLSAISHGLHSAIATTQWIISGYLLALVLMLPLNGWLVDYVGAKRLYLGCFSVFTLASLLCGAAQTINELIIARLLQGMAGGLMAPMAQMMIAKVAGRHMAHVMGYTAVPTLIAPILGSVLAGVVLKYGDWPWLFYLNLPMGILGVLLAAYLLPGDEAAIQKRFFDLFGFLLISPALVCLLYGIQNGTHFDGALTLLMGAILMSAFIWHGMRKKNAALIDLRLFQNRIFSTAAITQFLANGVFYAKQFLVPLYLISGCALSVTTAGWMMAATGLGMMCSFPLMGFLTERFGCRAVSSSGAILALVGMFPLLWMTQNQFSPALTVISLLIAGIGQGTISIPSISAAYASVPKEQLAIATTAVNIVQRLGGPLAVTSISIVISISAVHSQHSRLHPFMIAFVFLTGLHLLLLGAAYRLPQLIHQKK